VGEMLRRGLLLRGNSSSEKGGGIREHSVCEGGFGGGGSREPTFEEDKNHKVPGEERKGVRVERGEGGTVGKECTENVRERGKGSE